MKKNVIFIPGAGEGAHEADALLVASLRKSLGPAYDVRYPRMPNEADPKYAPWKATIAKELAASDDDVIVVGHSLGGSMLLKYLSEAHVKRQIVGLHIIAAPFVGADEFWTDDTTALPKDVAARLAGIKRIFLYHSRDDETIPFAHLGLYAARLPRATIREYDDRGHQFGNDLSDVAKDIRRADG